MSVAPQRLQFRLPSTVIGRFVAQHTVRGAAFWALLFGAVVASKAAGYATAYPTQVERLNLASSFGNNIGLKALLGAPQHLDQVTGFTTWNTLGAMLIIGSIWALVLSTRVFRGEEDAGRFELLLSGLTTARQAAANVLGGLAASLFVFYMVIAAAFILVGQIHVVNYGISVALFFALSVMSGVAVFMMVGAVTAQLMPTRARAAGLAAVVFGVCFLVRAMADTTDARWLLNFTPLGWIEKTQPLYGSQPLWLLPVLGLVVALGAICIWLAGRRDLGGSLLPDRDSSRPHTMLLNSPLLAAVRLTRTANIGWLVAIGIIALFFGLLTKSAAQAFSDSFRAQHVIGRLAHQTQVLGATTFLGIVFFLAMILIMAYAANAVGAIREDEAQGYLDNLMVRPVSRSRWLLGRLCLATSVVILAGLLISVTVWIGETTQQTGVSFQVIWQAGVNAMVPAIFVLGIGILMIGIAPRLVSLVTYGMIAWSFLIEIISSGINLNHWILDTSVVNHMAFAPATDPRWSTDVLIVVLGLLCALVGIVAFNFRDLQSE